MEDYVQCISCGNGNTIEEAYIEMLCGDAALYECFFCKTSRERLEELLKIKRPPKRRTGFPYCSGDPYW